MATDAIRIPVKLEETEINRFAQNVTTKLKAALNAVGGDARASGR